MAGACVVDVEADDLPAIVDSLEIGGDGARNVDGLEVAAVPEKPWITPPASWYQPTTCCRSLIRKAAVTCEPGTSMLVNRPLLFRRKPVVVPCASL